MIKKCKCCGKKITNPYKFERLICRICYRNEIRKKYLKYKEKILLYKKSYYLINKEKILKKDRDDYKKNPLIDKSRYIVSHNLETGKLKKGDCVICGSKNVQAHHEDYTKPLKVVWMCPTHHKRFHSSKIYS